MELRKLTTQREREIFGECLATARATRGAGFRERGEARFGLARLTFADAYGLFEHSDDSAENVKAGFIVHDLATLPQSFPKPDLSEFRAGSVIEGSDLWSLSGGLA